MKSSYKLFSIVIALASFVSVAHAQVNANIYGTVAVPVVTATVHSVVVSSTSTVSNTTTVAPVQLNVGVNTLVNTSANTNNTVAVTNSTALSAPAVDTSSNTSVSVTYVHPAKLFGFIPMSLSEKATVSTDAQGKATVNVHKPWWSIFASSGADSATFAAKINAGLQDQSASIDAQGNLSASAKAALVSQIETAAQATYNASASASANTTY